MEINWDKIPPEYHWAAMDENGLIWVYEMQPSVDNHYWFAESGETTYFGMEGHPGWRDSLQQRPQPEPPKYKATTLGGGCYKVVDAEGPHIAIFYAVKVLTEVLVQWLNEQEASNEH